MFSWGMREGFVGANPVINTNKREETARDRVLSNAELRTIWQALDDDQYGAVVKLLLLTGQRKSEIAKLRWSEIDFDRNVIALPASRTKNGRPHEIPMSETVQQLLKSQPRVDGRDLVFGKRVGPFSGFSQAKDKLTHAHCRCAPWTLHDLRRSAATGMAELGIAPHIIEAVLNHVSGHKAGIAGIYNRALYTAEKAQALARWDEHIASLVQGRHSTVTAMKRA